MLVEIVIYVGAGLGNSGIGANDRNVIIIEYPETEYDYPAMHDSMVRLMDGYSAYRYIYIITNSPYIVGIVEVLANERNIHHRCLNFIMDKRGVDCTSDKKSLYAMMAAPQSDFEKRLHELDVAQNWLGVLQFIQENWDEYGKCEIEKKEVGDTKEYHVELITGGWSENEEIVSKLSETIFWQLWWQESKRGGYYRLALHMTQ